MFYAPTLLGLFKCFKKISGKLIFQRQTFNGVILYDVVAASRFTFWCVHTKYLHSSPKQISFFGISVAEFNAYHKCKNTAEIL